MHIEGSPVSASIADWRREQKTFFAWSPSKSLLASIRSYQKWRGRGWFGRILSCVAVLRHRFWSVVTSADIPINSNIGGGLLLPHPNGIVIHPDCHIGPNCLILQQVTLGVENSRTGAPSIGGHVDVGAGAKIIGPVQIGDHAVIGANAVVLSDVPAGATAVGVPSRILIKPNARAKV